jgi:hypothetical protein
VASLPDTVAGARIDFPLDSSFDSREARNLLALQTGASRSPGSRTARVFAMAVMPMRHRGLQIGATRSHFRTPVAARYSDSGSESVRLLLRRSIESLGQSVASRHSGLVHYSLVPWRELPGCSDSPRLSARLNSHRLKRLPGEIPGSPQVGFAFPALRRLLTAGRQAYAAARPPSFAVAARTVPAASTLNSGE